MLKIVINVVVVILVKLNVLCQDYVMVYSHMGSATVKRGVESYLCILSCFYMYMSVCISS